MNKKLEQEINELNLLIDKGFSFSVTYNKLQRKLFHSKIIKIKKEFTIKEPTLAVLDLISCESVKFQMDEDKLKENAIQEGKKLTAKYAKSMARIVAISVISEDCFVQSKNRYNIDNKNISRLQKLFYHSIKPSDLYRLCTIITTVANLGDFLNSMRLTSGARTTRTVDIED